MVKCNKCKKSKPTMFVDGVPYCRKCYEEKYPSGYFPIFNKDKNLKLRL